MGTMGTRGSCCDRDTDDIDYCFPFNCGANLCGCVLPVERQPCSTAHCACTGKVQPRGCRLRFIQMGPFMLLVFGLLALSILGGVNWAKAKIDLETSQNANCTILDATYENGCPTQGRISELDYRTCPCPATPETICRFFVKVNLGGKDLISARSDRKVDVHYWLGGNCGYSSKTCVGNSCFVQRKGPPTCANVLDKYPAYKPFTCNFTPTADNKVPTTGVRYGTIADSQANTKQYLIMWLLCFLIAIPFFWCFQVHFWTLICCRFPAEINDGMDNASNIEGGSVTEVVTGPQEVDMKAPGAGDGAPDYPNKKETEGEV